MKDYVELLGSYNDLRNKFNDIKLRMATINELAGEIKSNKATSPTNKRRIDIILDLSFERVTGEHNKIS